MKTYVVVLPPPLNQLLCYHIPKTEQKAARCTLRQHRSSNERDTVKVGRVILHMPSTLGVKPTCMLEEERP